MTIEIHQPELEALIQQRMATGRFQNVEDVLLSALKSSPAEDFAPPAQVSAMTLEQVFAKAREILDGEELDFSRNRSYGRPVDLS